MTFNIQRLNSDFPIFLIENFNTIDDNLRKILSSIVLKCKERNHFFPGGSFLVDMDYDNIFKESYEKFKNVSRTMFGDYHPIVDYQEIYSYSSNKNYHGDIPGRIHNHINTSTINSVYYLNIPKSVTEEKGSITFFKDDKTYTHVPKNDDLLIFPNYLDHRINNYNDDEEWRISINMEITCTETSDELFSRVEL